MRFDKIVYPSTPSYPLTNGILYTVVVMGNRVESSLGWGEEINDFKRPIWPRTGWGTQIWLLKLQRGTFLTKRQRKIVYVIQYT